MGSRCKRPDFTQTLMLCPGVSHDGYGCSAGIYDFCIDDCQRLLRSFSSEHVKGSDVRACKDDRVTSRIALLC